MSIPSGTVGNMPYGFTARTLGMQLLGPTARQTTQSIHVSSEEVLVCRPALLIPARSLQAHRLSIYTAEFSIPPSNYIRACGLVV